MQKGYIISKTRDNDFLVWGRNIYEVKLKPEITCTCPDFRIRKSKTGEFCKHIEEVLKWLENS